jgi:hypothetical protein
MMMATHEHFSKKYGEPVWEIARLFPVQGEWTAEEYLALDTNHFVEFSDGYIEFLPMPTVAHQLILLFLHQFWFIHQSLQGANNGDVQPSRCLCQTLEGADPC